LPNILFSRLSPYLDKIIGDIGEKVGVQSDSTPAIYRFIFNFSLCSGTFSYLMKIAKTQPIHKKGGKEEISNYRPILILSIFKKFMKY
jgi:hypothetical protein